MGEWAINIAPGFIPLHAALPGLLLFGRKVQETRPTNVLFKIYAWQFGQNFSAFFRVRSRGERMDPPAEGARKQVELGRVSERLVSTGQQTQMKAGSRGSAWPLGNRLYFPFIKEVDCMQALRMLYPLWRPSMIQHSPLLKHRLESTCLLSLGCWIARVHLLLNTVQVRDYRNSSKDSAHWHISVTAPNTDSEIRKATCAYNLFK